MRAVLTSLSPKFHGAWLGAGTGASVANGITGLIQSYWTHAPLPAASVQLTYTIVGVVLAGFGAWIMPPGKQPAPAALAPASATADAVTAGSRPA